MQDIRLRIPVAMILSLVAFSSLTGAAGALLWWLVFAHPQTVLRRLRLMVPAIALVLFFAVILEVTGGGGLSYGCRLVVVILIGAWLSSVYRPGEFMNLGTWLFGNGIGFDLGMTAELGIQAPDLLLADLTRVRHAYGVKGVPWGIRSLVPAGRILISGALRRAGDTAESLAVKGYTGGGTCCPVFPFAFRDIFAAGAAVCVGIIAIIPPRAFFIL